MRSHEDLDIEYVNSDVLDLLGGGTLMKMPRTVFERKKRKIMKGSTLKAKVGR